MARPAAGIQICLQLQTFGALVAGQLAPGTMASAGPALRVFSSTQIPKKCYSTYHIEYLRPVHGALNVDKKKTNCIVW